MFIFKNFLVALAHLLDIGIGLFTWILIINIILSWVNADPYNRIVNTIQKLANFVLDPVKRKVNLVIGNIDFTTLFVILILSFVKNFLITTLLGIASRM